MSSNPSYMPKVPEVQSIVVGEAMVDERKNLKCTVVDVSTESTFRGVKRRRRLPIVLVRYENDATTWLHISRLRRP